jgi:hypothetical protein
MEGRPIVMATYLGFYTPNPDWSREVAEKYRRGELQQGQVPEPMATKVRELPQKLPAGCKLVGSWAPIGQSADVPEARRLPGVQIIETDDPSHLAFINQYYAGYLAFFFHPYNPVARA